VRVDPLASLTAKMTANTAGDGGRTWTTTELRGPTSNWAGPKWTPADRELAVFKTVCGLWKAQVLDDPREIGVARASS